MRPGAVFCISPADFNYYRIVPLAAGRLPELPAPRRLGSPAGQILTKL
jgi:hypothetical protein